MNKPTFSTKIELIKSESFFIRQYYATCFYLETIIQNSKIFHILKKTSSLFKIYFQNSSFRKTQLLLSSIIDTVRQSYLIDSFLKHIRNFYKRMGDFAGYSWTNAGVREMDENLTKVPVMSIGIFTIMYILANIFISLIKHNQISISGWICRMLFLSFGILAVSCRCSWIEVKNTSIFLKYLNKYCKI